MTASGVPVYRRPRHGGVSFSYGDFIPAGVKFADVEWGRWYSETEAAALVEIARLAEAFFRGQPGLFEAVQRLSYVSPESLGITPDHDGWYTEYLAAHKQAAVLSRSGGEA